MANDERFIPNKKSQPEIVDAEKINDLAQRALDVWKTSGQSQVYIGIAGAPGSGKSRIAQKVVDAVNQIKSSESFSVVFSWTATTYHSPNSTR